MRHRPNTARTWKSTFLEKAPDIFAENSVVAQYQRRIAELEQLVGKPEMESLNGRFKTGGESLFSQAQTLAELKSVVGTRIQYYNAARRHSSLNRVSSLAFVERTWSTAEG